MNGYNPNFYYLTECDIDHAILVLDKNPKVYVPKMHMEMCKKMLPLEIRELESMKKFRKEYKGYQIDDGYITHREFMIISGNRMKSLGNKILKLREIKDKNEVRYLKTARKETLKMINEVDGKTEEDLKKKIYTWIYSQGYKEGFEPIVANSKNARFPHYTGGKSSIKDYVLLDVGISYKRYTSDITRCKGDTPKEYELLKNSVEEIKDEAYAGRYIPEYLEDVERILKYWGIPELPHSIGHGVGLEVHELPRFGKKIKDYLKENSVITIEPGIYKHVGLRYEDMFLVGKNKSKRL